MEHVMKELLKRRINVLNLWEAKTRKATQTTSFKVSNEFPLYKKVFLRKAIIMPDLISSSSIIRISQGNWPYLKLQLADPDYDKPFLEFMFYYCSPESNTIFSKNRVFRTIFDWCWSMNDNFQVTSRCSLYDRTRFLKGILCLADSRETVQYPPFNRQIQYDFHSIFSYMLIPLTINQKYRHLLCKLIGSETPSSE